MKLKKITAACSLAVAALFGAATPAQAQISGDVIRIGIITDMSSVYADIDGQGGVEAIKMAIADAGGSDRRQEDRGRCSPTTRTRPTSLRPRRASGSTPRALDMLIGGTNSGTALAMSKVAAEKKKPFLVVGAASSALTNDQCTPYTVHWAYDTVALAKGTGNAVVKAGRQELVLPDRRLRLRRRAAERHLDRRQGRRRHHRRLGQGAL